MIDERLTRNSVIVLGASALAVMLVFGSLWAFTKGSLGTPTASSASSLESGDLRAGQALASPRAPLQTEQLEQLIQGLAYLYHDQYANAAPILGKYALLGDKRAQLAVGTMYYFGKGLPLDREEGIRWLGLAAAQGDEGDNQTLAAALSGSLQWEASAPDPGFAYQDNRRAMPQNLPLAPPATSPSVQYPGLGYGQGGMQQSSVQLGARSSVNEEDGAPPASHRYVAPLSNPPLGVGSPIILNRAGEGTYTDPNGEVYAQAGPHGVINTRTGEFSPTN